MATLNKQFLESLGVSLDDQTFEAFDEHFTTTLEDRVIEAILDELNEEQLTELSGLREQSGEELQTWLQTNIPELNQIVQDEVDILLGDMAEGSQKIS